MSTKTTSVHVTGPKGTNKTTHGSSVWQQKDGASSKNRVSTSASGKLVFQAKLNASESAESKTTTVKLLPRMGMRQLIDYALNKVRDDWRVTMLAYGMDIAKVLKATELIKTRLPFLHQHNEFIEELISLKSKEGEDKVAEKGRFKSGIKITLSRQPFDLPDKVGYQKPKPRIFMQPDRRAPEAAAPAIEPSRPKTQQQPQRKQKNGGSAKVEEELKAHEVKSKKQTVAEDATITKKKQQRGGRRRGGRGGGGRFKSHSNERENRAVERHREQDEYWHGYDAYQAPPRHGRAPPQSYTKGYDDDYDREHRMPVRREDQRGFRGGSSDRRGAPPYGYLARATGRYQQPPRYLGGPPPGQYAYGPPASLNGPERPGYFAGHRPFRMDKMHNQSLEPQQHKMSAREFRDTRNRPQQYRGGNDY